MNESSVKTYLNNIETPLQKLSKKTIYLYVIANKLLKGTLLFFHYLFIETSPNSEKKKKLCLGRNYSLIYISRLV